MALVVALLTNLFSGVVSTREITNLKAKELEELAKELEFIFEEAVIKDGHGNIVGLNNNAIEIWTLKMV